MYPRSKFQEILLEIREEMAREADFDVDLFVEMVRSGIRRRAGSVSPRVSLDTQKPERHGSHGKRAKH